MFVIRWLIGRIILLLNFVFSPKGVQRSSEHQQALDIKTEHLSLYQLPACPFCVKVRRSLKRDGLNINLRNINKNENYLYTGNIYACNNNLLDELESGFIT